MEPRQIKERLDSGSVPPPFEWLSPLDLDLVLTSVTAAEILVSHIIRLRGLSDKAFQQRVLGWEELANASTVSISLEQRAPHKTTSPPALPS